jgi:hypothetical protein
MEITPKIRKLIYGMFDTMIEGADKYVTKSSMWLIFTEEKRWVIEFTNKKTLWFNYNLFDSELKLLSMDCVDSKDIIKEWFESRFLEKDIDHVTDTSNMPYLIVENVVRNGVKDTKDSLLGSKLQVEDTIQNGVKHTLDRLNRATAKVEDTIQNGVKHTEEWVFPRSSRDIKMAIEFGGQQPPNVEKIITGSYPAQFVIKDIIQSGVKDTGARHLRINRKVDDVIQNGVKEIKHKMAESYQQKDHMVTNSIITEDINYAIENGVKETYAHPTMDDIEIEDTIQNGVKVIMSGSEWYHQDEVDNLVKNGVK